MNHRVWTIAAGAPSTIRTIAQTTDGTIWLGTAAGLYRFDGVRFVHYVDSSGRPFESNSIYVVAESPDGGLWVGFTFGGIAHLKDGKVVNYGPRDGLPDGSVWKIVTDQSGTVYAALTRGLFSLHGHRWQETRAESGESLTPIGLAVDNVGTLWVNTRDGMLARPVGEAHFRAVATYAHPSAIRNSMAIAPDGAMWVSTTSEGLLRIDAPTAARPIGTRSFAAGAPLGMLFDRDGNLWYRIFGVLKRARPEVWRAAILSGAASGVLAVGKDEELTLTAGAQSLEDREGNVWVASSDAVHCFSHSNILRVGLPEPQVSVTALTVGAGGVVWVVTLAHTRPGDLPYQAGAVIEMRDGVIVSQHAALAGAAFTAGFLAPDGMLWLGGTAGLTRLVGGQFVTTPLPDDARGSEVQAIVRDRAGAMWVSIVGRGIYRWADGQWTAYGGLGELPRVPPITEVADEAGGLWFGYTHGRIARVTGKTVRLFDATDGLDVGNVTALFASGTQLWAGGEFGVARFDGARFVPLRANGTPFVGLTGIAVTASGDLWTNGSEGIVHVPAAELARVIADPVSRIQYAVFDRLDGLPATTNPIRPTPSAIEASDGRLWFSVQAEVATLISIDPQRIRRNPVPPLLKIWTVRAGNQIYAAYSALHLPPRTTDLEIDYTAAGLTIPERVRFRYKLDGFDRGWEDVADRRQAFYTNLGPGTYTFRVIAANEDGVWNNEGASLPITIQPTYYQTRWFYAVSAMTGVFALWALYWVRMRQVRNQVRGRLEERLVERERIARDLHDTLLQGIQGLILRFQVATDRIPRGEAARDLMERALERADQVLDESRSRVKELRAPLGGAGELAESLTETAQPLSAAHSVPFTITVEGLARPLHPIVREEAYLIASEAITNAFRHAKATKIDIRLSYGDAAFIVSVRDDGLGIDGGVLSAGGKPEHWGLLGMRERARRIRGQLTIQSASNRGTEVQLRLPGEMAYYRRNGVPGNRWWRKLLPAAGAPIV